MHASSHLLIRGAEQYGRDVVVGLGVRLAPDMDRAPGEVVGVFLRVDVSG